jgi:phosphoglycolate phosphatase-like HAD superfamily hydrolase
VPISKDRYWDLKRRRVDRQALLALSEGAAFYDRYFQLWCERIELPETLADDRTQPGAIEQLAKWKQTGVRVILVTARRNPENTRDQLQFLGITPLLRGISVTAPSAGAAGKAAGARSVAGSIETSDALWVGDTEMDMEAAQIVGCRAWAITDGLRTSDFLASFAPIGISARIQEIDLDVVATPFGSGE